jgi:hypothetical protein
MKSSQSERTHVRNHKIIKLLKPIVLFTVPRYVTTGGSGKIIRKRQRERK